MQDIDQKKTILNDDAAIYQKREEREGGLSVKEKWKQLDTKGKFRFFVDYYLVTVLIVLFFAAILIGALYTMLKPKPKEISYIAVLDNTMDASQMEQFFDDALDTFDLNKKKFTITCNNALLSNSPTDLTAVSTYMFAGTVDLIIAPANALTAYCNSQSIFPLEEKLPKDIADALTEDDYLYAVSEQDQTSHAFGIRLTDTYFGEKITRYNEDMTYYLCVVVSGKNVENGNTWRMVRHILGLPQIDSFPTE